MRSSWRTSSRVRVAFTGRVHDSADQLLPAAARVRQVHGATCVRVDAAGQFGEADALWTNQPGVVLEVVTADCVPVLLRGSLGIAAVHAGWRGLAAGVLAVASGAIGTVEEAWIGPAIGPCCYEVGPEVAQHFGDHAGAASSPGPTGKVHLDLQQIAAQQLASGLIHPVAIHRVAVCTRCDPAWWSYRRDADSSGRNRSRIWLESERRA